jgi:hypothetical protein
MTKKDLIKQVEQLKKDLRTVCTNPNSIEGITIKFREQMEADTERAYLMYCNPKEETNTHFTGLQGVISGGVNHIYYADKSDLIPIEPKVFEINIDLSKGDGYRKQFDKILESGEPVLIALFEDGYKKYENGEWVKI